MSDTEKTKNILKKGAKVLSWVVLSVLCILLLIAVAVRIYLATTLPAAQLSRYMTSYLHQSFTVQNLDTSDGAILLKGVRLKNPDGFPEGSVVTADSVAIAPQWRNFVLGRQRFRLIALEGIKVSLDKNSKGVWNFSQIQQMFAGKKPSPTETYIKQLVVKDGALTVQGQGVQGIALRVFNLTTKGSSESNIDLAFEDAAHNRYALKGKARAGSDAALDLALTAPALSLKDAAVILKLKNPALFEGGKGAIQINASLHKGELSTSGDLSFSGLRPFPAKTGDALSGVLHFGADYSTQNDALSLKESTLTVNNLAKLHARGSVTSLKGERNFALYLGMDEVDLALLNVIVPVESRKQLLFGGRLRCDSFHLLGNGSKGLKSAIGTLQLRDGALTRDGRLIVAGLAGTIGVSRKDESIIAKGKLSLSGPHDKALLEALDLPFNLTLSPKLKPLLADIPALSATVMGIPMNGRVGFDAAKANPLNASLNVPAAKLSSANSLIKSYGLEAKSGTASVTLEVAGKSAQDLVATANLQLSELHGSRGKSSFGVKKGSLSAKVQRTGGRLVAQGDARLTALALNGKGGDARFGYRVADGTVYLDGAQVSVSGAQIAIAHLSAALPAKQSVGNTTRIPISLDMSGCAVKRGEMEMANLSGRMRGSFNSDSAGSSWLEGTADLGSDRLNWQGKKVAAPVLHAAFSRAGGKGELSGELLGGKLAGTVSFNPFAPEADSTYEVDLKGAGLAAAAPFVPKTAAVHPSQGQVDLHLNGGYSRRNGLSCRFQSKGSGIALTGGGGKALVTGAGMNIAGVLAGGNLSISEAVLSPGQGVALKLKGELAQALSPNRKGTIDFSLPATPLSGIVDPFINILPRFIQEATIDGAVAADGKVDLHQGKKLLQGGITIKGGRIEVPSQKLVVADVNGKFPFSLDLSGKAGGKQQKAAAFSRENYPRLLEQLRNAPRSGEVFTVGKIGFGALELGKLTLYVSSANGITEITSLNTSLFEGAIYGKGFLTMQEKLGYRGDLLINGLSMKVLCSKLPNLQGYISGRVDGVVSLSGGDRGLKGITGFTDLWAREGSGERMVVSKEFLQRLAKQKLSGFFFTTDRRYDQAEIKAMLDEGDLTFDTLKIVHTNVFGVRDLSVSIAPSQNRIALDHLLESIKEAAVRGKPATGEPPGEQPGEQPGEKAGERPGEAPAAPEFKWGE